MKSETRSRGGIKIGEGANRAYDDSACPGECDENMLTNSECTKR